MQPIDVTPPPGEPVEEQETTTPRRRRTRRIVLGSLLAVGLVGAAFIGTVGWRVAQQKDARLDTPQEVAGLRLDQSQRAQETADYLRTAIGARIDLDQSIGVVYADPASASRSVLLFGGTTLIWTPGSDLDTLFEVLSDDTGAVAELHDVDAGDLGGVMKCGESVAPEGNTTVCGWADHGSVVLALFPGRTQDEGGALLREIRGTIQSRD
ncbi:hypothetical protein RB614_43860 [Phytohabitans sp. ZYX-F-186]|uniref:DUF4367 domain-containing protein n=1 Tax=Phytohabitans maris TaxID=3071409 RepID=A0ABU0ZWM6_9ACTN|nr:hypothetical protein [Phytohabitans sp. ZYX-F-186]MDQ7911443.1 hypothetical protein [Phytohabitans sp. ZYX-F-186]